MKSLWIGENFRNPIKLAPFLKVLMYVFPHLLTPGTNPLDSGVTYARRRVESR